MTLTYNRKMLDDLKTAKDSRDKSLQETFPSEPERLKRFATVSDREIDRIYTAENVKNQEYIKDIALPGQYPFTRGVQPSMYRGRLWTMRMFAGLGSARDTNERFHHLFSEGQTGLSTAFDIIRRIDDMGGMLAAIEKNYPQQEIADAAYHYQKKIDANERTVVGLNKYVTDEMIPVDVFESIENLEKIQIEKNERAKNERNNKKVEECLERVREACAGSENVMEAIIDAVKEYATLQEVCDIFRDVFGEYRDPGIY